MKNDLNIFEPTHRDGEPTFSFDWGGLAIIIGTSVVLAGIISIII